MKNRIWPVNSLLRQGKENEVVEMRGEKRGLCLIIESTNYGKCK